MNKTRNVCPVYHDGKRCMNTTCGNRHLDVSGLTAHGKGRIDKSKCRYWHMHSAASRNWSRRRQDPRPSPTCRGTNSNNNINSNKEAKSGSVAVLEAVAVLEEELRKEELTAQFRKAKSVHRDLLFTSATGQRSRSESGPLWTNMPPTESEYPLLPRRGRRRNTSLKSRSLPLCAAFASCSSMRRAQEAS
jgi:hypothetical protein